MVLHEAAAALDWVMDKSLVLGYTKIGPAVRRNWWPHDPVPGALIGRHVLVTGASGGLGLATARGLAGSAPPCTSPAATPPASTTRARCCSSEQPARRGRRPTSRTSATSPRRRSSPGSSPPRCRSLHAVVHNAGVMPPKRTVTPEGHELTLATHVLGPHVLTYGLRKALAGGRVVLVTSGGAYGQRLDADDPEYHAGRLLRGHGLCPDQAHAARPHRAVGPRPGARRHPRPLDAPRLGRHPGVTDSLPRFAAVTGPLLRDADSGADTAVWLTATDDAIGTGGFWHDRRRRPTHYAPVGIETPEQVGAVLGLRSWTRPSSPRRAPEARGRHTPSVGAQGRSQQVQRSRRR